MTAIRIAAFCCLLFCVADRAHAIAATPPTLYHNPATGHLWLTNPLGPPLTAAQGPIIYFKSASNGLIAPVGNPIPGATYDTEDFPAAHTFYNVPIGSFNLGQLIQPGLPSSDITLSYLPFISLPLNPLPGIVITIPEPATIGSATMALLALAALRRRRKLLRPAGGEDGRAYILSSSW